MKTWMTLWLACAAWWFLGSSADAIGLRGGGGGRAGGFSGGGRMGGGAVVRPSVPNLGGGRPAPNISRPNITRPTPNITRPSTGLGGSFGGNPTLTRPNLPSGGLKPTTRPSLPTTRPGTAIPGGVTRPSPGTGGIADRLPQSPNTSLPTLGGNRPGTSGRPSTLPGGAIGGNRPTTRPASPETGVRPGTGLGERPTTLPGRPGVGDRPTAGDLGDFLGMQRPITRPGERPGLGKDPPVLIGGGQNNNRPGVGDRLPGQGAELPGLSNRLPDRTSRPDWFNRVPDRNTVINRRPSWVNIDNSTNINIHNRWNNSFNRPGANWWTRPADRLGYWHGWGNGVRNRWSHYHHCHNWFTPNWWYGHYHGLCGWHYHWRWGAYPVNYWWTIPTWGGLTAWFNWSAAPVVVWRQPVYYDYGAGGNVVYQNNAVYIGGEQVATADEFAQSAAALATVEPPANDAVAQQAEWMPLGTFIVTTSDKDVDSPRSVQLAVSKEGIVSGTLYNTETDQAQSVQGQVDKETQRVAIRIGNDDSLVVETGLYNLTQDEVPLLVHFGTERVENWLLVRLEGPAASAE